MGEIMKKRLGIGVIGCGMISEIYMKNCSRLCKNVDLIACADTNMDAAEKRAGQFGCRAETVDSILSDPSVDIILNLTPPLMHSAITLASLKAGKHVYSEKPFSIDMDKAREIITYAKDNNLYVGGAPDCFMGHGIMKAEEIIASGTLGRPFAVQAFMFSHGPDFFHPSPEAFYKEGGGPVFDWGPYYISALVYLLGPVTKLHAAGSIVRSRRRVLCPASPKYEKEFSVEVPTYVTCILEMESGVIATISLSFDMYNEYFNEPLPYMRIFGTDGCLDVPDLNRYSGESVPIRNAEGVKEISVGWPDENERGLGLDEMASAILNGGSYHVNPDFMLHVTEILCKMQHSAINGTAETIESRL